MSTSQTKDLWTTAVGRLVDDDKAQLDVYRTEKIAVLDDVLSLVRAKQTTCLQKRWKFKKDSGESLVVRDLVDKIAVWVGKFINVGDVAVQYDQSHAALPWAAVRFLLQITLNDAQTFGAIAEGVETVSRLISRYAIFEVAYLQPSNHAPSKAQKMLSEALVSLYSAVLTWLAQAGRYYKQSTVERLARSIVKPVDTVQKILDLVRSEELVVDKFAEIVHAEMTSALTKNVTSLQDNTTKRIDDLEKLIKALDEPLVRTVGTVQDLNDHLKTEERRGLLAWLSRTPCREHHDITYREVLPDTGLWLLNKADFLEWQSSSSSSLLWLHGIPGAGKSKLTAIVIQKFLDEAAGVENAAPLAYFYCSREKSELCRVDPTEILRAILKQLSSLGPDGQVRHAIAREYKQRRLDAERDGLEVRNLAFAECTQLILELTSEAPATILIDGVDELGNSSQDLLDALRYLVENSSSVLKIFVSSREDAAIARNLHHARSIRVTSAENSKDVTVFVNHYVSKAVGQKRLLGGRVSSSLQEDITTKIIDGAGEMFLWASMQLQHLCNGRVFKLEEDVVAALRKLPPTLEQILDRVYESVNESEEEAKSIAKQVFAFLLVAQAPISASDMMASLIRRNSSVRNDAKTSVLSVDIVLDICCNLLMFDDNKMIFRFIHPSVPEYLERRPEFSLSNTHHLAFQRCLEYYVDSPDGVEVQREHSPLSEDAQMDIGTYAASYWGLHYSRIDNAAIQAASNSLLLSFAFDHEGTCFQEWLDDANDLTHSLPPWDLRWRDLAAVQSSSRSPLLAASIYGLLPILEHMHSRALAHGRQIDFNEKNIDGASAIYLSARYGNSATLDFLIAQNCSVNTSGGRYGNPLQAAAFHGHGQALQILLDHGADPFGPGKFEDVLQAAVAGGCEDLIQRLLPREDIASRCNLKAALMSLCYAGHHSTVSVLLDRDNLKQAVSEPNNLSYKPVHQALQLALYRGRASVARTLLAQCEDVNATGGHFGNLIQAAAFGGHETMVRWLIDLGADVHVRGRYGSPLRAASLGGHNAVVQLLLNRGARTDKAEDNALQAAALNGHFATSKLLVDHSEEAYNWSACYESALEAASFKGHLEIVQFLLQNRPRRLGMEFEESEGNSAMRAAVISGQESVVNMLIEEIPQLRRIGRNMIVMCSVPGTLDLLPPKPRATPCPKSSSSIKGGGADIACIRPCDTMKDLFDWESLTKRADRQGNIAIPATNTPLGQEYLLRIAAGQGSKRMIEHLMACGFGINEIGNVNANLSHQPTALEVAASKSELDIVELLLRRGAILGKALHFAVRDGKLDVVRSLLAYRPEAELDCFIDPAELQGQYQRVVDPVDPVVRHGPYWMHLPTPRRDMSNRSPLAIAVEWGHDEIVSALLRHKAKSRHPGIGLSMLVAARNGFEGMIRVFMEYGRATNGSMNSEIISDFLLEQSIREASANGHLHIVKALLEHSSFYEHSQYIFIAICEARIHGHNGILVDLRALAPPLDSHRSLGVELAAMASTQPNKSSITPYLELLFDRLSSERVDPQLCTTFKVKALRDALKTGQYEAARFLLEKDKSCRILETETDILHFAIRTIWINEFSDGRDSDYGDLLTYRDLFDVFIKHGASTESFDSLGNTPLFYACSNPIPGVFDILIESKVSPWTEHALRLSDSLESTVSCQEVGDANKFNLLNVALQSRLENENIGNLTNFARNSRFERKNRSIVYSEWEKIILFLLDLGMPFDPSDPSLVSFLHVACLRGRLGCVQRFAKGRVDFHAAGHCPKKYFLLGTALHAAVIGGQLEVLRYLLEIGVDVRQKAVSLDLYRGGGLIDETATQTAVRATENTYSWQPQDHWDVLKILLELWDGMVDYTAALHAAIEKEKVEIVDLLLDRCTKFPNIPLCQNVEIVKLFIDHGITIRLPSEKMMRWHEEAIERYNVPLLELLIAQSGLLLPNPLSHPRPWSYNGDQHLNMIRFLLDRYNCDINATFRSHQWFHDVEYDTNMLLEARLDQGEKTIKFLLEHGADPDGPGLVDSVLAALFRFGRCQFFYTNPTIPEVRLLLDHGAEINGSKTSPTEAEKYPRTLQPPLIRAIEKRNFSMVEFLVSSGADVNATSGPETPLHLARREGHGEIAEYLIIHGAIDRYEKGEMGRRVLERPGLTPVTTESLRGHDKLRC